MESNESLSGLFGPLSFEDVSYEVFSQLKIYGDIARLYIPNKPIKKLKPFVEARKQKQKAGRLSTGNNEANVERSLRRTRSTISDICLCNPFEWFGTFTFAKDRADIQKCKNQMQNWIKNLQKRKGKFSYIFIPERHKKCDPCAQLRLNTCPHDESIKPIHFHALLAEYPGVFIDSGKRINSRKSYHLKEYRLGLHSVIKIDNPRAITSYVRKYITKEMPRFPNKRRFWASKDLHRPQTIDNPQTLDELGDQIWVGDDTRYGLSLLFLNNPSQATRRCSLTEDGPELTDQGQA